MDNADCGVSACHKKMLKQWRMRMKGRIG